MMELWPFTNFHDLNLDWIINRMEQWTVEFDNFLGKFTSFKNDVNTAITNMEDEIPQTISDILSDHEDWYNDYVTPEQFGAVGDGVTDDTAAVQAAMAFPIVMLKNKYLVSSTIDVSAVELIISDGGTVFGTIDGPVMAADKFDFTNIGTTPSALTEGDEILPISYTGDMAIWSTTLFNSARAYYNKGEFNTMNGYQLETPLADDYPSGSTIYSLTFGTLKIEGNLMITNNETTDNATALYCKGLARQKFAGVSAKSSGGQAIIFDRCYRLNVECDAEQYRATPAGLDYGVAYLNCCEIVDVSHGHGVRHGITFGGNSNDVNVVCTRNHIRGCYSNESRSRVNAVDLHGNANVTEITGYSSNGVTIGGRNLTVHDITGPGDTLGFRGAENVPGYFNFSNIRVTINTTQACFSVYLSEQTGKDTYINLNNIVAEGSAHNICRVYGSVSGTNNAYINMNNIHAEGLTLTSYMARVDAANAIGHLSYNNVMANDYSLSTNITLKQQGENNVSATLSAQAGVTLHAHVLNKSGNVVTLRVDASYTPANNTTSYHILDLPVGYRPPSALSFYTPGSLNGDIILITVTATGEISVRYPDGAGSTLRRTMMFTYAV